MNNENQIPIPLDGFEFRAGFDAPTLVTISPERLALALASARPAYRDPFVSALDAALGGDAVQRLRDERDEARATLSLVHSHLERAWRNRTLPADVISSELARRMKSALTTTEGAQP